MHIKKRWIFKNPSLFLYRLHEKAEPKLIHNFSAGCHNLILYTCQIYLRKVLYRNPLSEVY